MIRDRRWWMQTLGCVVLVAAGYLVHRATLPFRTAPAGVTYRYAEFMAAKRALWPHPAGTPDEWWRVEAIRARWQAFEEGVWASSEAPKVGWIWEAMDRPLHDVGPIPGSLVHRNPLEAATEDFAERRRVNALRVRFRGLNVMHDIANLPCDRVYVMPEPPGLRPDRYALGRMAPAIQSHTRDAIHEHRWNDAIDGIAAHVRLAEILTRSGTPWNTSNGFWQAESAGQQAAWIVAHVQLSATQRTTLEGLMSTIETLPAWMDYRDALSLYFEGALDSAYPADRAETGRAAFHEVLPYHMHSVEERVMHSMAAWVYCAFGPTRRTLQDRFDWQLRQTEIWQSDVRHSPTSVRVTEPLITRVWEHPGRRMHVYASVAEQEAKARRSLDIYRLVCAINQFVDDHGAYPVVLEDLVPEYLHTVPVDRAYGTPIHYRYNCLRAGGGFILYGRGIDRVDDGGFFSDFNPAYAEFRHGRGFDMPLFPHREERP